MSKPLATYRYESGATRSSLRAFVCCAEDRIVSLKRKGILLHGVDESCLPSGVLSRPTIMSSFH